MATSVADTKSRNSLKNGAKVKIVNTIPNLNDAELGECFLLISDGATDTNKLYIRTAAGWLKFTGE